MDFVSLLSTLIPSFTSVGILFSYFVYLAVAVSLIPGKIVPGVTLSDGSHLYYRCNGSTSVRLCVCENGLASLLLLIALLGFGVSIKLVSPMLINLWFLGQCPIKLGPMIWVTWIGVHACIMWLRANGIQISMFQHFMDQDSSAKILSLMQFFNSVLLPIISSHFARMERDEMKLIVL